MIKLSPSSLNIFLECPRCFWLSINKAIKRPSIPVATITSGLDRVIKEYFDNYRKQNILPPLLEGKLPGRLIRNFPKNGWLEFMDKECDAKLGGYLDECLDLGNNFYAPLDHKTRGLRPEGTHKAHQFQMDTYTLLLEENKFPTKKIAYLVYYIPKTITYQKTIEFEVVVSEIQTDPQRAQKTFYQAISVLKGNIPLAAKDCEFCRWTQTINIK